MYSTLGRTAQKRWSCEKIPHTQDHLRISSESLLPEFLASLVLSHTPYTLCLPTSSAQETTGKTTNLIVASRKNTVIDKQDRRFFAVCIPFSPRSNNRLSSAILSQLVLFSGKPHHTKGTHRALTVLLLRKETGATRKHSAAVR